MKSPLLPQLEEWKIDRVQSRRILVLCTLPRIPWRVASQGHRGGLDQLPGGECSPPKDLELGSPWPVQSQFRALTFRLPYLANESPAVPPSLAAQFGTD